MIRKTIQVDIPSCQQAKFLRCSLAINYHLLIVLKIVGPSPKYAYISAVSSKELEYFLSNL
jgi:hypothetical protein